MNQLLSRATPAPFPLRSQVRLRRSLVPLLLLALFLWGPVEAQSAADGMPESITASGARQPALFASPRFDGCWESFYERAGDNAPVLERRTLTLAQGLLQTVTLPEGEAAGAQIALSFGPADRSLREEGDSLTIFDGPTPVQILKAIDARTIEILSPGADPAPVLARRCEKKFDRFFAGTIPLFERLPSAWTRQGETEPFLLFSSEKRSVRFLGGAAAEALGTEPLPVAAYMESRRDFLPGALILVLAPDATRRAVLLIDTLGEEHWPVSLHSSGATIAIGSLDAASFFPPQSAAEPR